MVFLKRNILKLIIICCLTSCVPIARTVSTPTYSQHSDDKIYLDNRNGIGSVFIKKGLEKDSIQTKVVNDIEIRLKNKGIKISSDINNADYILSINIRNISSNLDYNFANDIRNALVSKEVNYSYEFDSNNVPHVNSTKFVNFKEKSNITKLLPSALYSMLGSSVGFALGFTLAGSCIPFMFGVLSAVATGSVTYVTYNYFRKTGIVVSYDISIDERQTQILNHNRKTLTKKSSNSSDETYYSYKDNWNNMVTKNIIIAIGSKALIDDMMKKIHPMIVDSVVDIFNSK